MSLGKCLLKRGKTTVLTSTSVPREPLLFLYPAFDRQRPRRIASYASVAKDETFDGTLSESDPIPSSKSQSQQLSSVVKSKTQTSSQHSPSFPDELSSDERALVFRKLITKSIRRKDKKHDYRSLAQELWYIRKAEKRGDGFLPNWRMILSFLDTWTPQRTSRWHNNALRIRVPEDAVHGLLFGLDGSIWDIKARTGADIELVSGTEEEEEKKNHVSKGHRSLVLSGTISCIAKAAAEIIRFVPECDRVAVKGWALKHSIGTKGKKPIIASAKIQAVDTHTPEFTSMDNLVELQPLTSSAEEEEPFHIGTAHDLTPDMSHSDVFQGPPNLVEQNTTRLMRYVRAEEYGHMRKPCHVDQVPVPEEWTSASFARYIKHLVLIQMTRADAAYHYNKNRTGFASKGRSHNDMVLSKLLSLFRDPAVCAANAISVTALNDALAYCVKHSSIRHAQDIFMAAEQQQLRMHPETFEIMLRGASKVRDFSAFHHILSLMVKSRCTPTTGAWLAFLRMVDDIEIKRIVLKEMVRKNLVHEPALRRDVCTQFIRSELSWSLKKQRSHDDFVAHMDECYGDLWLSIEGANLAIDCLTERGLISRCWEFLQFMLQRNVQPDAITITEIISNCSSHGNFKGGLEVLHRLSKLCQLVFDELAYETFWNWAWKQKAYNLAAIIWRYACLDGQVSYKMELAVTKSIDKARECLVGSPSSTRAAADDGRLLPALPSATKFMTDAQYFNTTAGMFILLGHPPSSEEIQDATFMQIGSTEIADVKPQTIRNTVKQNLGLWKSWRPIQPFVDMMVMAYEKDLEWKASVDVDNRKQYKCFQASPATSIGLEQPKDNTKSNVFLATGDADDDTGAFTSSNDCRVEEVVQEQRPPKIIDEAKIQARRSNIKFPSEGPIQIAIRNKRNDEIQFWM